MSVTDDIYTQLKNGLWTDLDYDGLRLDYDSNKSSFYNALQKVFAHAKAEMTKFSSELKRLKEKGDEEKAKLLSLANQQDKAVTEIEAKRQEFVKLETDEQAIKAKTQELGAELNASAGLLNQAKDLEKMGFNSEKLQRLSNVIVEIGTKHGQKADQAIDRFFADLNDYDSKAGFEREVQRLETITETKRLEAEKWQAEEQAAKRKHDELKETVRAVYALRAKGVKDSQIITWQRVLNQVESVEQFEENLRQYGDITKLVNAKKEEAKSYEARLTKVQSQVKTLEKEKIKIEAEIESLGLAGVNNVKAVKEAVEKETGAAAATHTKVSQALMQQFENQLAGYVAQVDGLIDKTFAIGRKYGELEQKLRPYGEIKGILEAHAIASKAEE